MKFKQYLTLGVGIIAGFGISVVGVSYASKNLGSNVKSVTPEVAKSIMLNKVQGANIIVFSYDGDDKTPKYDGTLIKDNYEYEIDVNAQNGKIIKFEKETIFVPNSNGSSNGTSTNNTQNSNASTNNNLNTSNNVTTNNNASTNNNSNVSNNTTTNKKSYIGESKAKSIMLNKVPGATIRTFKFDNDSTPEYEAELVKDGYEYDISVNAYTGAIKEFSKERIDAYDDDRYDDDRYDD